MSASASSVVIAQPDPVEALRAELQASTGQIAVLRQQASDLFDLRRDQLVRCRHLGAHLEGDVRWLSRVLGDLDPDGDRAGDELRGRRIANAAVAVLELTGEQGPINYQVWYRRVENAGHLIAGKNPAATFLTAISRDPRVERVGPRRSGMYRLRPPAAA